MSKFVPNKEHSLTALIFCFHLKKTAAESYRLLREAYGEHAPSQDTCERRFRRFKSGDFDVADKEHGKSSKRYEDVELQALLDEDDSQTQKQLAEQLSVSQQIVSNRLREMEKIQKVGRWIGAKTHMKFCSNDTKESHSCIVSLLGMKSEGMKSGYILRIPSAKNHE
ncbi:Mariner Mos1 transposase [Acromyrmex echinatior]|uniref:Mariner Mos1 transposase n=1 Tax=Acromyrmex echinatior TaxID=103372 RepID=F4X691_ACREC|nr:Mariner Mos1 transposase [Acromyrmex echinatior]